MHRLAPSVLLAFVAACGGGSTSDAGMDAGTHDAGGTDSGAHDAGATDTGATDGGATDGGATDGGATDSGATDGGSAPDLGGPDLGGSCDDPPPSPSRAVAGTCSACRPDFPDPGPSGGGGCSTHADCTAGMNGRCVRAMVGTYCDYDECFQDTDCATDQLCACDGSLAGGNTCVPADCRTNADCASGACAPSYGCLLGAPPESWHCRTASDACASDADCTSPSMPGGRCAFDASVSHWACDYGICVF